MWQIQSSAWKRDRFWKDNQVLLRKIKGLEDKKMTIKIIILSMYTYKNS